MTLLQGPIISENVFMDLEGERFKRVSSGELKLSISMEGVKDIVQKNPSAFKDSAADVAEAEEIAINDIMVYNKSVFDMCNEILGDLHHLRHFGKDTVVVFSKKSAFANRFVAECIPLTTLSIASYVMSRIQKVQTMKKDILTNKKSADNLTDSSRITEEFERQYNFLLTQTIDDTTDILMARLLVDTVQYCRGKY
jgi:hypothetical protein